jgi:hypothetical protein
MIQMDYSESVVRSCFSNIRAITHLARKQKFLTDDPGEDVTMPITKLAEKPVMSLEQSLSLLEAITELHDLCLMFIGIIAECAANVHSCIVNDPVPDGWSATLPLRARNGQRRVRCGLPVIHPNHRRDLGKRSRSQVIVTDARSS